MNVTLARNSDQREELFCEHIGMRFRNRQEENGNPFHLPGISFSNLKRDFIKIIAIDPRDEG